jgi:hypothetical protein
MYWVQITAWLTLPLCFNQPVVLNFENPPNISANNLAVQYPTIQQFLVCLWPLINRNKTYLYVFGCFVTNYIKIIYILCNCCWYFCMNWDFFQSKWEKFCGPPKKKSWGQQGGRGPTAEKQCIWLTTKRLIFSFEEKLKGLKQFKSLFIRHLNIKLLIRNCLQGFAWNKKNQFVGSYINLFDRDNSLVKTYVTELSNYATF